MKELQKLNYIYIDKEKCCEQHFWWRILQCMGNERPMYHSNGQHCEIKTFFEDHESNSPTDWTATTLFETLGECCREKFWWDIDGCLDGSPKKMTFKFSININGLIQPHICQDADRIANALEVAANVGFRDEGETNAFVTSIGCLDLARTNSYEPGAGSMIDGGFTKCRGNCLTGNTFIGDYDGTRTGDYWNTTGKVTLVEFDVHHMGSNCESYLCFQTRYNKMVEEYTTQFVNAGRFTTEITSWATESVSLSLFPWFVFMFICVK